MAGTKGVLLYEVVVKFKTSEWMGLFRSLVVGLCREGSTRLGFKEELGLDKLVEGERLVENNCISF